MNVQTEPAKSETVSQVAPNTGPLLVLISGPSGGGKTTVWQQLLAARPQMSRVVTCTTRPPRPGERESVDYYFLDADSFLKRVQAGNFLEHATVYGNSYGTLKSEVLSKLRQGTDVLLSVDVQGAAPFPCIRMEGFAPRLPAFEGSRHGDQEGRQNRPRHRW